MAKSLLPPFPKFPISYRRYGRSTCSIVSKKEGGGGLSRNSTKTNSNSLLHRKQIDSNSYNEENLVGWLVGFLTSSSTTRLYRGRAPRQERLTILRAATHETELGDHGFCFSRSHYTDTDPTSRERAATAGIEPGSSSPGVARSTAELPRPP